MVSRAFFILCLTLWMGCKSKEQASAAIPAHLLKTVVLCFHDITEDEVGKRLSRRYSVSLAHFRRILDALAGFKVVSLSDWVEAKEPGDTRPRVVLTFDDGYAAHRQLVLPELTKRKMGATFFFYADQVKRDSQWRRTAAERPDFDFGSHSWSHALLKDTPYDTLFRELYLARNFLEEILRKDVKSFAWPYGYYDAEGVTAAKNAGFAYQVSVDYRIANRSDIAGVIPRYTIFGKDPGAQVKRILDEYRQKIPSASNPAPRPQ